MASLEYLYVGKKEMSVLFLSSNVYKKHSEVYVNSIVNQNSIYKKTIKKIKHGRKGTRDSMNRHEGPTEELWAHRSPQYKGLGKQVSSTSHYWVQDIRILSRLAAHPFIV